MKPHRGTVILVLGVLGLIGCPPCGIFAWLMGSGDLKQIAAGTMDPAGKDLTNIGRILGIIATVFIALSLLACIGLFILSLVGAVAGAGSAH